ncbi:MAG: gluconeogenesis factor YvcK family protein [Solirubrobacteraceae bacterium]
MRVTHGVITLHPAWKRRGTALAEHTGPNDQVVALGGGRGLVCVLRALRSADLRLTVITSIAAEGDRAQEAHQGLTGPVGDLRRSLEALSDQDGALLHAIRRPLTVDGVGLHPLGDLTLTAAADALGGYGQASMWLGDQLGIDGAVLPATIEPATSHLEEIDLPEPVAATGQPERRVKRLRFAGGGTDSPEAAIAAIQKARWVLLTPGALYRHVLSTCAVPDLAAALTNTSARVVWIANLEPDPGEAPALTANDHVLVLRLHGVRVDAVMHDPSATLAFDTNELAGIGVESVTCRLRSASDPGTYDPERLEAALTEMLASPRPEHPPAEATV